MYWVQILRDTHIPVFQYSKYINEAKKCKQGFAYTTYQLNARLIRTLNDIVNNISRVNLKGVHTPLF